MVTGWWHVRRGWRLLYRCYNNASCFGHRPNRGITPSSLAVDQQWLASRRRAPELWALINAYRENGYRVAPLDPLSSDEIGLQLDELELSRYGIELEHTYNCAGGLLHGLTNDIEFTGAELLKYLHRMFCGTTAIEVCHIPEETEREWLVQQYELAKQTDLLPWQQERIAVLMGKAETLDLFLATKRATLKRYGGEGAESLLPMLDHLIQSAARAGVQDLVISQAHRGKLNLQTILLGLPPAALFSKIDGASELSPLETSSGDVLTHLRSSVDFNIDGDHMIHVSLLPCPSHLEVAVPVAMGKTRGRQLSRGHDKYMDDTSCSTVLCTHIHGDAAFSGQGVVMETLSMSNLPHYTVDGCVHIVTNNRLGFTTPEHHGRSSLNCSDVMKMIHAPIIHINGTDPEGAVRMTELAVKYRNKFHKDICINLWCYRKRGHNEGDEPSFTQPNMYAAIQSHPGPPAEYYKKLDPEMVVKVQQEITDFRKLLEEQLAKAADYQPPVRSLQANWKGIERAGQSLTNWDTGCSMDLLKYVAQKSITVPEDMAIHSRLVRTHIQERSDSVAKGTSVNWATAEAMAFGTLLLQGFNIRLSGQDVGRGTFSHRHVMLVDQVTGDSFIPLNGISSEQPAFLEVANSNLSEEGVVGFEYGFSTENPQHLVIWEAQFGDFFNGAQVMFDTLLSSGEAKWQLQSGLVILLPHGMDGAGPEHSSCRMERFLQCCTSGLGSVDGDDVNWTVAVPTSPAQYFHLLRQQMIRPFRKPLIVVAPKILLRHPIATSSLNEMSPGTSFKRVISDDVPSDKVSRVIFCSGKYYYSLKEQCTNRGLTDTAIIRLESLCPFPARELYEHLNGFSGANEYIWAQEESQNMGAWSFVEPRFRSLLGIELQYRGRGVSAAPATGVKRSHDMELQQMIKELFD